MKFKTILEYLVDEIKSDLNDVETMFNGSRSNMDAWRRSIRECIGSIRDKLDMICE